MNVVIINDINEVADTKNNKPGDPLITRDGAKLVSYTVESSSLLSAVGNAYISLMKALPPLSETDKVYILHGTLSSNMTSNKYTFIVGVTGIQDLDTRLADVNGAANKSSLVQPDLPGIEEDNVSKQIESDAEIVEDA